MTADDPAADGMVGTVVAPQLLGFYRVAWDHDGTAIGWETVARGLVFGDGSVVSVPVDPPLRVTMWRCLDDALIVLDAFVDDLDPRRTIVDGLDVSPLLRSSTVPPPAGAEGVNGSLGGGSA